jgi:hypothetical protein
MARPRRRIWRKRLASFRQFVISYIRRRDVRGAIVCSLITSAKLNNVEPFAYLTDFLERMTDGHPMSRLDDLLPWNWVKVQVKQ